MNATLLGVSLSASLGALPAGAAAGAPLGVRAADSRANAAFGASQIGGGEARARLAPVVLAQGLVRERRERFHIDDSLGDPPAPAQRKNGLDGMSGHGIGSYGGRGIGSYTGGGLGSYTGGGLGDLGGAPSTFDGRAIHNRGLQRGR